MNIVPCVLILQNHVKGVPLVSRFDLLTYDAYFFIKQFELLYSAFSHNQYFNNFIK